MSMIVNASRFVLFGPKMDARITLGNVAKTKGINIARGAFGMPPVKGPTLWDWIVAKAQEFWSALTGRHPDALPLPEDLPVALFNVVNDTLKNRGGLYDKDFGLPNYWVSPRRATSTPFFWSLIVDYSSAADPSKVAGFEMALEDQLTKAGFDYNVRIQKRPLRLEIDKPNPPTITLAELWPQVAQYKQNQRWSVLGLAYLQGQSTTLSMSFEGEDFSAFIAGMPGSGKTQLSMSILLSLAYTNSPEAMPMIIVDPKAIDFRPFNRLPHLVAPVITEPAQAVEVIQALCDEMDRRTACAAKGDNSFFAHTILLYIDELADLVISLPEDEKIRLAANIQRIGQKGRGVGFIVIAATQRVFDLKGLASMYSKLSSRFVGRMRTASDSSAASGIDGTTTHKLPGKGSFELYCSDQTGLRLQAPFVAASDKKDYVQKLAPFFNDIDERWKGMVPGWMPPSKTVAENFSPTGDQATAPATNPAAEEVTKIEIDARIWQRMTQAYQDGKLTGNLVRNLYQEVLGKGISGTKVKEILDAFAGAMQDAMTN